MFEGFAKRQAEGLRRAFADDAAPIVFLRTPPDLVMVAAKLVAGLGRAREAEELIVGVSVPFADGELPYAAMEVELAEALDELEAALLAAGRPARVPKRMVRRPPAPAEREETLFAELLERAARAAALVAKPLVLALRFDPIVAKGTSRRSLSELAASLASPLVKVVVFDDLATPVFADLTARRPRLDMAVDSASPAALLRGFLADPQRRVLLAAPEADGTDEVFQALSTPHLQLVAPFEEICFAAPFLGRASFCDRIYRATKERARTLLAGRGASAEGLCDLPPTLHHDERSLLDPEVPFTELMEAVAEQLDPSGSIVVIAIEIASVADVEAFVRFADRLGVHAASPRVKYLLVAPAGTPLPAAIESARALPSQEFVLPVNEIAGELTRRSEDPATPVAERAQLFAMLSGQALAERRLEVALERAMRAIELAAEAGEPAILAGAFLTFGGVLRRQGEHASAHDACERALDMALQHGAGNVAAMALLELGNNHFHEGAFPAAAADYDGAAERFAEMGHTVGTCTALIWAGEALAAARELEAAEHRFNRALELFTALDGHVFGDQARAGRAEVHQRLARLHRTAGDDGRAARFEELARRGGLTSPVPTKP